MESRARLFGHAIHPILIVYPLGLLSAGVIFDVIYLVTGNQTWTLVSFWMIAAGIVVYRHKENMRRIRSGKESVFRWGT